jgi:hypothetical protein
VTRKAASGRAAEVREEIARLDEIAQLATEGGSFTAAVQALRGVGFLRQEAHRLKAAAAVAKLTTDEARLRKMAQLALLEGSFVAAEKLTRQAAELRLAEEREQRERELADRSAMSPDELIEIIEEAVRHLPRADLDRLRQLIEDRA